MPLELMLESDEEEVGRGGTFRQMRWLVGGTSKSKKYWRGSKRGRKKFEKENYNYEDGDVVMRKNNTGVLNSSKKLNPVWKGIYG